MDLVGTDGLSHRMASFHTQVGEGENYHLLAVRSLQTTGNATFIAQVMDAFNLHTTGSREFN